MPRTHCHEETLEPNTFARSISSDISEGTVQVLRELVNPLQTQWEKKILQRNLHRPNKLLKPGNVVEEN
jgi:hypothetical protein